MRIRILDRILVALAGLLMLAAGAAVAAQLFFGKNVIGRVQNMISDKGTRAYLIIGGIILCLLGVYCVMILFRHRGRNGKFIMQKTDSGELAISLKALESMVQKCLDQYKEVNAESVSLDNQKGSLLIRIRGTVAGGISIPLTVDTLQQQIKQYVTACSGVEVREIKVEIESSGPDAKDAPFAIEAPAATLLLKASPEAAAGETIPEAPTETAGEPGTGGEETSEDAPAEDEKKAEEDYSAAAAAAAAAAATRMLDEIPEEDDDRPFHQRLFSNVEEPCVMPMPPADLETDTADEGTDGVDPEQEDKPREETEQEAKPQAETEQEDEPQAETEQEDEPQAEAGQAAPPQEEASPEGTDEGSKEKE